MIANDPMWARLRSTADKSDDPLGVLREHQTTGWQQEDPIPTELYLLRFPELNEEDALVLIMGEVTLRWERGQHPTLAEYEGRFPRHAADLAVQFDLQAHLNETAPAPDSVSEPPQPDGLIVPGYVVEEQVGRGTWGVVYRARHFALGRQVALKLIRADVVSDPKVLTRFLAEGRVIASLDHPHIIKVYDVGRDDDRLFLALELADSGTLAGRLAGKPLPTTDAARLAEIIARASGYAHAKGVVHRDLKPGNVLLFAYGSTPPPGETEPLLTDCTPKLADFGLARQLDLGPGMTTSGQFVGTPAYMSPEQAKGEHNVGPEADVYSIGVILYELLTGRPPLLGSTTPHTLRLISEMDPVSPRDLNALVPVDLATICMKCLEKDPARRYPTGTELADDLARFLGGKAVAARPVRTAERFLRWGRRNPRAAIIAGAVVGVLGLLAIGGTTATAWLLGQRDEARDGERRANAAVLQHQRGLAQARLDVAKADSAAGTVGHRARLTDAVNCLIALQPDDEARLREEVTPLLARPDWKETNRWVAPGEAHRPVAISPKFEWVVVANPATGATAAQNVADGKPPVPLKSAQSITPQAVTFSDDGRWLAVTGTDGERKNALAVLAWPTGDVVWSKNIFAELPRPSFDAAGTKLVVHDPGTGTIRECDLAAQDRSDRQSTLPGLLAAISPDGTRLAVLERNHQVAVAKVPEWEGVNHFPASGECTCIAWSPDNRTVATGTKTGAVHVYELERHVQKCLSSLEEGSVHAVAISPDNRTLAAAFDNASVTWDLASGRLENRFPGRVLRWSKDGQKLAVAEKGSVVAYERLP